MRFNKPAYPTVYFSAKIWVQCPNCSEAALVTNSATKSIIPPPSGKHAKCTCSHCGFQKEGNQEWHGYSQGFIERACGFCGTKICFTSKPTKTPFKSNRIKCDHCSKEKEYTIHWYRYTENKPTDPYFGFDLWLQTTVKNNILWLYNLEHLNYLREYVSAKLREDNGRHKYSMITNLPQWLKSAKHRALLIKKMDTLEYELQQKLIHLGPLD